MSKPTIFIAVQCCQCSTMQVKQQKKSNNKWSCAVCNEKQSIRKIYAQGYQAKEIRQVVQSLNMARKLSDEQDYLQVSSLGHFVKQVEGHHDTNEKKLKRRTDWSEYVDVEEHDVEPGYLRSQFQGDEISKAKIVTELPEDLTFKKPKSKGSFNNSSRSGCSENRGSKPQLCETSATTKEATDSRPDTSETESFWNTYKTDGGARSRDIGRQFQQHLQKNKGVGMMTGASKWAAYLAEDDDGAHRGREKAHLTDDFGFTGGYEAQTEDADQLVEEDVHPDFM